MENSGRPDLYLKEKKDLQSIYHPALFIQHFPSSTLHPALLIHHHTNTTATTHHVRQYTQRSPKRGPTPTALAQEQEAQFVSSSQKVLLELHELMERSDQVDSDSDECETDRDDNESDHTDSDDGDGGDGDCKGTDTTSSKPDNDDDPSTPLSQTLHTADEDSPEPIHRTTDLPTIAVPHLVELISKRNNHDDDDHSMPQLQPLYVAAQVAAQLIHRDIEATVIAIALFLEITKKLNTCPAWADCDRGRYPNLPTGRMHPEHIVRSRLKAGSLFQRRERG
jgi:hypothetical protein